MTRVLYPGSFDPVHNGHIEIITTASELFDEVVVAAMRNPQKGGGSFSLDEREEMIQESVGHLGNVSITMFSSLVVDLAKEIEADFIIKGLRRVGLRERTPDGTDEQRRLRGAHPLHPLGVEIVVPRRSSFERSPSSVAMCRRWCRRRSTVASRNVSGEWGAGRRAAGVPLAAG